MDTEKIFYNAVAVALQGDPWQLQRLKKKCGPLLGGWKTIYENLGGYTKFTESRARLPDPETEWEKLENAGVRLIFPDDADFPELLRHIPGSPLGLYIRGEFPQSADSASISIVGTRRATVEGKSITKRFARELADAGMTIVSGLALGVDATAHEGCLEGAEDNGTPSRAIAVLAAGLDNFYPAENERLGKKILESGGAIISEYPLGESPYPYRFLERNRIVSGISKGVLVIEAPKRSGSLATATFALQQNRDVFVVPGQISHPNFFGSHWLIRQGAELVTKPEDILEAYGFASRGKIKKEGNDASDEEKQVLTALRSLSSAAEVDKIIEMTKLEPRIVNQALSFLVLKHIVKETESGYIIEEH